jgi:hypothetical protein
MATRATPNSIMVNTELTAPQWRIKATVALYPVTCAKNQLSASLRVNEVTMLAAADALAAATRDSKAWFVANACPDLVLRTRVAWMLNTCSEVALTAQWVVSDPSADTAGVIDRLEGLLAIIDIYSQTLDNW